MIWNLVAVVFAGLGAAGVAMLLRLLSKKKLPKWIIPAFAGVGMLASQIYMEYTALDLIKQRLPEGTVVMSTETGSMVWRPWTYYYPMDVAFTALDERSIERGFNNGKQGVKFVLYRFEKHYVAQVKPHQQLLDCESGNMLTLDEQGQPDLASVVKLEAGDRLRQRLCQG
ncbi:MAG: hypothetical protein GYB41_03415 [Oceanospirillales bacterium]|uniref:Uncharacterized protein n=1 Tax=Marinobacterium halophilum TaxID=267374 RepID=A0A2P8ES90_9GAMM|nr:hypothetical protein [Marinobacterium halophilum]MBR9827691.1 hypothetical protein [Oceanospirillales bacterium]PSL12356.1 hypothetical protein CLV44_11834 [Marinobacterium halophilum]